MRPTTGTGRRAEAQREGQPKERRKAKQVVHRIRWGAVPAPKKQALSRNFDEAGRVWEVTMAIGRRDRAMKKQEAAMTGRRLPAEGKKRRKKGVR